MDHLFGAGSFDEDHFGDGGSALEVGGDSPGASSNPAAYFGEGNFDAGSGAANLDLASDSVRPGAPGAAANPGDLFGAGQFGDDDFDTFSHDALDVGVEEGSRPAAVDVAGGDAWPTGKSPEPNSLQIDDVEVAITADYGAAPANIFVAPPYALRVFQRKRVLEPAYRRARETLEKAEAERDALLGQMITGLREKIEADDRMKQLLTKVGSLEQVVLQRSDAAAGTNAEYDERVGVLDEHRAKIDGELAQKKRTETEMAGLVGQHEQVFKRAEAMLKRVHIEIRSVTQVVQQRQAQGATATPEQQQQLAELQNKVPAAEAEARQRRAELDQVLGPLEALRAEMQIHEGQLRDLENQRRVLDQEFQKVIGVRSQGVDAASQELADALADAGRGLLATRGGIAVDQAKLDSIRSADETVRIAALEAEKEFRALESYSRDGVKQGYVAVGIVVGLIVLLIVIVSVT